MTDLIYINGQRIYDELPLRSLFFGEGIFETFRYKSALPVHFDKHMTRLKEGTGLLNLEMPDEGYLALLIDQAVKKSEYPDLYVKLAILSEGSNSYYEKSQGSQVLILIKECLEPKDSIKASVCSFTRNSRSPIVKIKSFNYLENIIARREAMAGGFDEVVFLNEASDITEGSAGNIFWYKEGTLYTPSAECGLLPGTTREVLLEAAQGSGLVVKEGRYPIEELKNSDFAFFTNSLIGAVPISQIDSHIIPFGNANYAKIKQALLAKLGW